MNTDVYWFDYSKRTKFRQLTSDLTVDVLGVGAGVTGMLTAYLLQKAGIRVAVIERAHIAARDCGHTTAHLTCVTDKRLTKLVSSFGRSRAKATWEAGTYAID